MDPIGSKSEKSPNFSSHHEIIIIIMKSSPIFFFIFQQLSHSRIRIEVAPSPTIQRTTGMGSMEGSRARPSTKVCRYLTHPRRACSFK
jgi:hypothetical protein